MGGGTEPRLPGVHSAAGSSTAGSFVCFQPVPRFLGSTRQAKPSKVDKMMGHLTRKRCSTPGALQTPPKPHRIWDVAFLETLLSLSKARLCLSSRSPHPRSWSEAINSKGSVWLGVFFGFTFCSTALDALTLRLPGARVCVSDGFLS